MKTAYCSLFLILFAMHGSPAWPQHPVILQHADHLESYFFGDSLVTRLQGDVHFQHGTASLWSQRAVWHRERGQVIFSEDVVMLDDGRRLTAQRVIYNRPSQVAVAEGDVEITDQGSDARITGGRAEYHRETEYYVITQNPTMTFKDPKTEQVVVITGDVMELFSRDKRAVATGSVVITRGELTALCQRAEFLRETNKVILEGDPMASHRGSQLKGRRMEIFFQDEEIQRIVVFSLAQGNYVSTDSTAEPSESQLAGRQIAFEFQGDEIKEISVKGNATSLYIPSDSMATLRGKNDVSGDSIFIGFSQGQMDLIQIQGGAMGSYFSPDGDTIQYRAESIDYSVPAEKIILTNHGYVGYRNLSLQAGTITYHTQSSVLEAEGRQVVNEQGDTSVVAPPVLDDGKEQLVGRRMDYNLKTGRGSVEVGQSEFQQGFYQGQKIRKVAENTLLVRDGEFTTCDQDFPHYHFQSRRMKIRVKDKVIAKPVILYIGHIPVAAIPFYIFPIKPGRHSGFLTFDLGVWEVNERFLRNFGYYFAPSEYWDMLLSMDLYEKTSWLLMARGRYALRYKLRGELGGSYKREREWVGADLLRRKRWDVTVQHAQDLSPTWKLVANGTFVSDKEYYPDVSDDPQERMNRTLHSHATISKTWQNATLSLTMDQNKDLDAERTTQLLPTIRYTRPAKPIFSPSTDQNDQNKRWYHLFYLSQTSYFVNYRRSSPAGVDKHLGLDTKLSLKSPQRLLGWLTLTPSFDYQETWYNSHRIRKADYLAESLTLTPSHDYEEIWFNNNQDSDSLVERRGFARRGTYQASLNANTTLYGTFYPHLWRIVGFRHLMKPSLTYSWRPEFPDKDTYYSFAAIGGAPGPQKRLGFDLNNIFQIKFQDNAGERKVDLATLNFSSGYDFRQKVKKLSPLISSLRVNPGRTLGVTMSTTHDFYHPITEELDLWPPRLSRWEITTNLTLSGRTAGGQLPMGQKDVETPQPEREEEARSTPWKFAVSHRYAETRMLGTKTWISWVNGDLGMNLSPKWRVDYSARYDMETEKVTEQKFVIHRDLHCWEALFVWIPTGFREGYYIRINVKALPEVKVEKREGVKSSF